jgi:glycosyltransferase involved in cell wall biosynthesis
VSRIGFLIRARNEADHIGFAIQSVYDLFGNDTPICVVDNDSQDDTLSVVDMFPRRFHNISLHRIDKGWYTPGRAINMGVQTLSQMDCDLVGILSAHCEMRIASREIVESKFADEQTFAIMGKQVPIKRGKRVTPRYIWSNFQVGSDVVNPHETPSPSESRPFFHNAFSFIRVSHWQDHEFDEDLAGKEDRYWAQEHILRGRNFILTPDLECRHFWTPKGATWAD